ncbi:MAG: hypothetical protein H6706_06530 [Myxococcales bacterium]|nr:hypothetical protein [Myxococcales bacterium]
MRVLTGAAALTGVALWGWFALAPAPEARRVGVVAPAAPAAPATAPWETIAPPGRPALARPTPARPVRGGGGVAAAPAELTEEVLAVAYDLSPGSHDRYRAFIDTLRLDGPGSTARLAAALAALSPADRAGSPGRMLLHTLGEVGHRDALPVLAEAAQAPLPPSDRLDHHYDPRDDAARTRVMAVEAMEAVAVRYGDEAPMGALRRVLDALIDEPDAHPAVLAAAASALRRHARDPDAMAADVEARLPAGAAHLAYLVDLDGPP